MSTRWLLLAQLFVIGHDCGHRSFSKNKLLEDIVGTLAFMPLIYPFEPWRIKHNHHHAHTNKCARGFTVMRVHGPFCWGSMFDRHAKIGTLQVLLCTYHGTPFGLLPARGAELPD